MGKRSDFQRRERDFYPTPYDAVVPLLPHLPDSVSFHEPCCGDCDLVNHLVKHGHWAGDVSDIGQGEDAATLTMCLGDMFITNPPWKWEILSTIIINLSNLAPTWLLLNADLMHNKRMGPFMEFCEKVVSVGRVSWMQNGKKGFENCAWFLFDQDCQSVTKFYGRAT
jgi:hypothetical protein